MEAPRHLAELAELYRSHIEQLTAGYSAALERHGYAALVVDSGPIAGKSRFDDAEWPFRPCPTFAHIMPLREADAYLLLEPGRAPELLRSYQAGFWDGPAPAVPDWVWAVIDARPIAPADLPRSLPAGRLAAVAEDPARLTPLGIATEDINPPALVSDLHAVRTRKTDYERACMRAASRRAARGHDAVFRLFRAEPASELLLHLEYLRATQQDDAETPYKNIVALCQNAAILHHVHYGKSAPPAERSLLLDAGASFLGYSSDISRTDVIGDGSAAGLFRQLVDRMEALQLDIVSRVRPGLPFEDLHDQCHQQIAPILRELDLVRASDDELVATGATRRFLAHGLGHSLGIQIHDVGMRLTPPRAENPFLRNTSAIAPGQVFTIEPGLYFTPELMDRLRTEPVAGRVNWPLVDALARFGGVRIEDNIAVLDHGVENFTRDAWAELN